MIIIIMGVSGSGKTTVGRLLAEELSFDFADADDYHSPQSIEKMSTGRALTDEDRGQWLERLRAQIESKRDIVLACSALKHEYRSFLSSELPVRFIYLKGSPELIASRLRDRREHFAPTSLLDSQFAALEEPGEDHAMIIDVDSAAAEIIESILPRLSQERGIIP
ncbi:MAG: gluconokinase [Pyrinomonadaceae bacterium]